MGYLFLFLAIIAGSTKGYCGKKTSSIIKTTGNIAIMSTIRMLLCSLIGFFFVLIFEHGFDGFKLSNEELIVCLISAIGNSFFVITWTIAVKKSAYSMISIFTVLSTLLPIIFCKFVWDERFDVFQMIGFVLLFFSIVFMWIYNGKTKGKFKPFDIFLLVLCGLFNAVSFIAQKWRSHVYAETLSSYTYNFYTFLFSVVILLVFAIITKSASKEKEKFEIKNIIVYVIILSVCLFANSLLMTLSADTVPSSVLYPLSNGVGLVIAMLMGQFFFQEKINKYSILGICIALVSFIFMVLGPIIESIH